MNNPIKVGDTVIVRATVDMLGGSGSVYVRGSGPIGTFTADEIINQDPNAAALIDTAHRTLLMGGLPDDVRGLLNNLAAALTTNIGRQALSSATPPAKVDGDVHYLPAAVAEAHTFKEHEQAVLEASARLALVMRRAEEAGHGLLIQMTSGPRQRSYSIGIERDTHPPAEPSTTGETGT